MELRDPALLYIIISGHVVVWGCGLGRGWVCGLGCVGGDVWGDVWIRMCGGVCVYILKLYCYITLEFTQLAAH